MGTFHQWLEAQRDRQDSTGELARWWAGDAAERPRASTPSGIQKYLDKELREGKLKDLEAEVKGRMREQFADAVREYHDRDKPPGADPASLSRVESMIKLVYARQERILSYLGAEIPPGLAGFLGVPDAVVRELHTGDQAMVTRMHELAQVTGTPPDGIRRPPADRAGGSVPAGRREALEIRARMGDRGAAAELAAAGAEQAPDGLEAHPAYAGDPQGAGEALSDDLGELSPEDWDLLWRVADRRLMSWAVDLPDDYVA